MSLPLFLLSFFLIVFVLIAAVISVVAVVSVVVVVSVVALVCVALYLQFCITTPTNSSLTNPLFRSL